jgi:hypothetical protein
VRAHGTLSTVTVINQIFNVRKSRHFGLTFRWIAGHNGIEGNEKSDREEKRAAEGDSSAKSDLPRYLQKPLKKSISAMRQKHNAKSNKSWEKEWQASERFKRLRARDIVTPSSKKYIKLIKDHRTQLTS